MKRAAIVIFFITFYTAKSFAQATGTEDKVLQLSKDKWQWMSDKDVGKLSELFDSKARFVHMGGTWKTPEELEIIKSGSIWYRKATIHDSAVEVSGNTAIVWNRITLESTVRGNEAKVEFTVTEVYQMKGENWKLLALTFSSVRDTHELRK